MLFENWLKQLKPADCSGGGGRGIWGRLSAFRIVPPGKQSRRSGAAKFPTACEVAEQRVLLSGDGVILTDGPMDPTGSGTFGLGFDGTGVAVDGSDNADVAVDPMNTPEMIASRKGDYEALKAAVDDYLENWARQQHVLAIDGLNNGLAAVNQLVTFLDGNPENLRGFSNTSVNIVWAGAAITPGGAAGAVGGLGAVALGIAVNVATSYSTGSTVDFAQQLNAAIENHKKTLQDQIEATKQEWDKQFQEVIRETAPTNDVMTLQDFFNGVRASLMVVEGAAPHPPTSTEMYVGMLRSFARDQGWQIEKYQGKWRVTAQAGMFGNVLAHTDWPGFLDATDIVDELNRLQQN